MAALLPNVTILEFVEHVLEIALSVAQRTILAAYYMISVPLRYVFWRPSSSSGSGQG